MRYLLLLSLFACTSDPHELTTCDVDAWRGNGKSYTKCEAACKSSPPHLGDGFSTCKIGINPTSSEPTYCRFRQDVGDGCCDLDHPMGDTIVYTECLSE